QLEVSAKTTQRDLDFMRDRMGLPVDFDLARQGWVYTEPVEAFPALQISEGELFALLVAEKALQQYRGTPFEPRLVSALRKLARALPDTVSLHLDDWEHAVSFRTTAEPILNLPVMEALADAIQHRRQVRLNYRKPGARADETRVVDPVQLANVNGDWYLFAFDQLRQDIRKFVPARIRGLEPTGRTIAKRRKFEVEQQLRDSFGIHSREGDFAVVIRFDEAAADYIREKRWHPSQKLAELPDGGVELRLRLGSLVEVERGILGWGGRARARAPRDLAAAVRAAAARLAAGHAGG
ncbi:MAG TPA: WYL domain-containing protein, partial [Verrucomicrobiota bacterium]|nr:WYL domain-containing protein [Verrucomicrobiota bacterium]